MEFSEQIKSIRAKNAMTQEQFAAKLNVTRQAVSNWENDKNLPDIGMLITISNVFGVSLDYLIKGEENMSNMTQKVIRDGSATRRARFNMVTAIIGGVFILLGILLIAIKATSVEYIDEQGILHENFYLVVLGMLSLFCGVIAFVTTGISAIVGKIKGSK